MPEELENDLVYHMCVIQQNSIMYHCFDYAAIHCHLRYLSHQFLPTHFHLDPLAFF